MQITMEKMSPRLQDKINAAGPDPEKSFNLIITLNDSSDWDEGVRLVQEAGLQIDSRMEEIRTVSGKAATTTIQRIAEVPAVVLIEIDELASTMGIL
jgi:hypothetical protein